PAWTTATAASSRRWSTRCWGTDFPTAPSSLLLGAVQDLELGEPVQAPGAVLDADTAPLGAAEGLVRRERQVGVHPCRAALEALGHVGRPIGVAAPDGAAEAEVRGVGPLDGVVDVAVGDHRQGGAELLLVDDARAVGEVGQDRRLEEVPRAVHGLAAGDGAGATLDGVGDELGDTLELRTVVDRAQLGVGVHAVSNLGCLGVGGEGLDDL